MRARITAAIAFAASALLITGLLGALPEAFGATTLNLNYEELNFDYTSHTNYPPTGSGVTCTGSNVCTGMAVGDKVLFANVTTIGSVAVDGIVTTSVISGTTITNYEVGVGVPIASNFQVNTNTTVNAGYVTFTFDFCVHGTYPCSGSNIVTLNNVQMTGNDIDAKQYNAFSQIEGYTMVTSANGGTLTAAQTDANPGWPHDYTFSDLSSGGYGCSSGPECQAVVSYGSVTSTAVQMGRVSDTGTNFFGIAFKALAFTGYTATTVGTSYTVSYDLNGGSGTTPAGTSGNLGQVIAVAGAGDITRAGYTFVGWNTVAGGTGQAASLGGSYTVPLGNSTLYAQWATTVTFDANGGTGSMSNQTASTATALTTNGFARTGYSFAGWNTAANGSGTAYANLASYPFAVSATLYAQWTATVTFDANGGTGSMTSQTASAATALTTNSFTRSGYTFTGWNTAANATGTAYANLASYPFATNATMYAQWTADAAPVTPTGGGAAAAEPTPSPTASSTTRPSLDPIVNPIVDAVKPGGSDVTEGGVPVATTVAPNASGNGLKITAPSWALDLAGLTPKGAPAPLGRGGAVDVQTGASLAVSGSGFAPGTEVKVYIIAPSLTLGTFIVGPDGTFSGTVPVPLTLAPGSYVAQVNGYSPSLSIRSASIGLGLTGQDIVLVERIKRTVYFDSMSGKLDAKSKKILANAANLVPGRATKVTVQSIGFVQPTLFRGNDFALSTKRARNVVARLKLDKVKGAYYVSGRGRAKQAGAKARRTEIVIAFTVKG